MPWKTGSFDRRPNKEKLETTVLSVRGSAYKYLRSRFLNFKKVCKKFHFLIYVTPLVLKLHDLTCLWEIIYISQRKLENSRFLFTGERNYERLKTCSICQAFVIRFTILILKFVSY